VKAPNGGDAAAAPARRIDAFRIGVEPVTNAQFLDFVTARPEWRKLQIKPLFADERYLRRWPSDLELADSQARNEPVTNVSWFAARAYCSAQLLRLPSTDEWEYVLADAGRSKDAVRERSLEWLALPNPDRPSAIGGAAANGFGVKDMVGLVWEWTEDFNAYAITAESRLSLPSICWSKLRPAGRFRRTRPS
jgi:formylglycine-generating enzyme required for sulfatase activity